LFNLNNTIKQIIVEVDSILSKKVSFQIDTWAPISQERTVRDILNEIKSDKYAHKVHFLRGLLSQGNRDGYGIHKKTLACVTFCATFDNDRKKDSIKEYNNLIVLDIDKLDNNEFVRVKQILKTDDYVLAYWDSPSGNGLKGLVHVSYEFTIDSNNLDRSHKSAFLKLSQYFTDKYGVNLDESGSDTTRLCFLSHDKGIVIKAQQNSFKINENELIEFSVKGKGNNLTSIKQIGTRDVLFNPLNKNRADHRKTIQSIIKYLERRKLSITSTYEEWYKVAYAIADTFTYEIGEKYFISLCKLDETKYNEDNCKNMLKYSYGNKSGQVTFSTIVYFANQKGYLTNAQRGGVSKTVS